MADDILSILGATGGTNSNLQATTGTTTAQSNIDVPNPTAMNYSASDTSLPDWYKAGAHGTTDYYMQQLANLPTGGYTGARVAGLAPTQQTALGQAGGYLETSQPLYGQGATYQQQGGGLYGTGAEALAAASPYFQQGAGFVTRGGAIYDQAGNLITGAAQYDPTQMAAHMSPYTTGALNELSRLSTENLMQKVLPEVQSTFVGAGQFGGTRSADFTNRAIRDQQRELAGVQAKMLEDAYGKAAQDYLQWGQLGVQGGAQLGGIGQGVGALGGTMGQLGQGITGVGQTYGQLGGGLGTLGSNLGTYGLSGLKTGLELGGLQQAQTQRELDAAKAAWEEQYSFPTAQFGALGQAYNAAIGQLSPETSSRNYSF